MDSDALSNQSASGSCAGPLILVGGAEFTPGNEPHDRRFVDAVADGPAYVIPTAAARQDPARAVRTARRWFATLGLPVEELPLLGRRAARDPALVAQAADGRGFYLCGGDPGLVVRTLAGTPAWEAVVDAWRRGAVLAGSSAGAMAFGEWTLLRARHRGDRRRRYAPALGLLANVAVVPHLDEFGHRWLPSALSARPTARALLLGIDVRTAAVWDQGRGWSAMGAGGVSLLSAGDGRQDVRAGDRIRPLPPPGG